GETVLHLVEAGHMELVTGTEGGQRRHVAEAGIVRFVLLWWYSRCLAGKNLNFARLGEHDPLTHVSDDLVRHDHDRGTVLLGQVESADHLFIGLLNRGRHKADGRMITVGAP